MQIIVLGMHRSGTSAVTRVINLMGAYVGDADSLMPPQPYNPLGFWERTEIAELNDRLLDSVGASWSNVLRYDAKKVPPTAIAEFEERARSVVDELDANQPWVVKDPRLCLLLEFWLKLLKQPVCVLVARDPLEVALSLRERNDFPLALGVSLWEHHVLSSLRGTQRLPRTIISYEDLIADAAATTQSLYSELRRLGVRGIDPVDADELKAAIDPRMRHHRDTPLDRDDLLNRSQLELAEHVRSGAALEWSAIPDLSKTAKGVLELHYRSEKVVDARGSDPVLVADMRKVRKDLSRLQEKLPCISEELTCLDEDFQSRISAIGERVDVFEGRARLQEHRVKLLQSKQEDAASSEELQENARLQADSASSRRELRATQWRLDRVAERARETIDWQADRVDVLAAELIGIRKSRAWKFGKWLGRVGGLGGAKGAQADRKSLIQSILEEREAAAETESCSPGVRRSSSRRLEVLNEFKRKVSDPPSTDGELDLISEERFTEIRETLLRRRQGILVSIILTMRGKSDLVSTAIDSAKEQSYTNWELIVVEDGSDPDFASEINRLAARDQRIGRVHSSSTVISAMRNEGLQNATGSALAFLDPHGYWEPDFLLFMVNALLESGSGCAYAAYRVIRSGQKAAIETHRPVLNLSRLRRHNEIDLGSFVFRAVLADDLGGFDESLEWCDDWDLILRYVTSHPPAQVAAVLATRVERQRDKRQSGMAKAHRHALLNRHAIDWRRLEAQVGDRVRGHVTIVIPVFGQIAATKRCLQSVVANQPESNLALDVVVVDNGNAVADRNELREIAATLAECEVVENEENYGFGLGCNLGFARSRGEFVVFLNSDTEVSPGWLEALLEPFTNDPEIGIVGPKLLYPDGTLQCGGLVFNDRSVMPYHIYKGFPGAHGAVNKPRYFQAVTGACVAVRAVDFVKLRGFDPIFINGCEDIDFCLRMQRDLGKLVFYNPASEVRHREGLSIGRNLYILQNREFFVDRWRGAVMPDDQGYHVTDSLRADRYVKLGREPDGETAIYVPVFAAEVDSHT